MDQRISLVTLAVTDLKATKAFYVDRLGWQPIIDVPGDVLMFQVGQHLVLSWWDRAHFEAEVGPITVGEGVAPITLAYNVGSPAEVDAVLAEARAAGADPVEDGVRREWGGYTGYFGDPDGYRWEVAHAPGELSAIVVP